MHPPYFPYLYYLSKTSKSYWYCKLNGKRVFDQTSKCWNAYGRFQERKERKERKGTLKVKSDHRSKFSKLNSWKEEAWKISGLQRDSSPWPPRYQCDARPTELWSHTLGARSICWVQIFPCNEMMWKKYEIHIVLRYNMNFVYIRKELYLSVYSF